MSGSTAATERLWFHDSHRLEFDGRVVAARMDGTRAAVELDRTAFYPTGGGQPHDTGVLRLEGDASGWRVDEVAATEDDRVVHYLSRSDGGAPLPEVGATLHGAVDAARRRDHLQQHTGQHLLSAALVRAAGIATKSFHMGATTSTIDVEPRLTDEPLERAVALANEVVFDDRATRIHLVGPDQLERFAIRRQTFTGAQIRLIEVPDFDVSTCGGTHAQRTGEVGLIAVLGVEKSKGLQRVEFVCGGRALQSFTAGRKALVEVARELSCATDLAAAGVRRLADAAKAAHKRATRWFEAGLEPAAAALAATARPVGAAALVTAWRDDLSFDEALALARATIAKGGLVVALAVPDGTGAKLLLARSNDVACGAGELVKQLAPRFQLRGGGSPPQAQAALPDRGVLDALFAELATLLAAPRSTTFS
ncbi:MAG: alanyl-tRNA editing protein [Planctomycetes bacterium]|nr:alanyl-tRNA editing protein [Planctomycetota bacterium]